MSFAAKTQRYHVVDFDQVPGIRCPCGIARRALADVDFFPGTIHRTEFTGTGKRHYHRRLTETYYILEAEPGAYLELDGELIPAKVGLCVVIPPGVVHRGIGRMTVLNIVFPKFDPTDEFLVDETSPSPAQQSDRS
ncbi:MAG: cupin domain-containing protein [Thermoguttaceae bacterium]|nr:cupin domain-containing protein [Thermoguttaceae bacterium]MDW8080062.1 cupin domain-containing protein [Thermoguttaceae bacterium]